MLPLVIQARGNVISKRLLFLFCLLVVADYLICFYVFDFPRIQTINNANVIYLDHVSLENSVVLATEKVVWLVGKSENPV